MKRTKIEWCDSTWNPITGCYHGCEYCYAQRIAKRFGGNDTASTFRPFQCDWHRADDNRDLFYDEASREKPMLFVLNKPLFLPRRFDKKATKKYGRQIFDSKKAPYPFDFNPTFHRYRLGEPERWTKPRNIFVCSMADLFGDWVPDSWIEEVFAACERAPQHNYIFLTKNPKKYLDLEGKRMLPKSDRFWFGTTITKPEECYASLNRDFHYFLSIEPLLEPLKIEEKSRLPEWIIVGAETGNRKNKVVPQKSWIEAILRGCDKRNIPVFMKDSLIPIMGEENMRREFPAGLKAR